MEEFAVVNKLTNTLQARLSEAMTNLVHRTITLTLKHSSILPITDVKGIIGDVDSAQTTVYIPIMGDVIGDIFLLLPAESATSVADMMIGNPIGTTRVIGEFEMSALKELGNITTGVIVTELADTLKMSMMLTVPNVATDMVSALIDQVLIEYGITADHLLAIEFPFAIDDGSLNGTFLLLFNHESSLVIEEKLRTQNG